MIEILDNVLSKPHVYRIMALAQTFRDQTFGPDTFRGIASRLQIDLVAAVAAKVTNAFPHLSFFRKSSLGQREPNYVHSDEKMGRFTAIYYMNPEPAKGDGTMFWDRVGVEYCNTRLVDARFNRLLVFDGSLHHSRALIDNYGEGDDARLIQVVFLS